MQLAYHQKDSSVLPGYPPHPLSLPAPSYSHPQWDLILLGKQESKSQQEKHLMDEKYPRVARAKQAQKFADTLIERWRLILKPIDNCDEVLVACTTAPTPSTQLKEFKSLASFLQRSKDDDCVTSLLQVLCAMHTHCLSRHPLQRAIGRVLMDTASSRRDNLVHSVLTNQIKQVVKMEGSFDVLDCLAYLEAVTENFSIGFELLLSVLTDATQKTSGLDHWDAKSVEVVTACCKDVMVIINKYAEDIKAIMVGMETDQLTMEWPQLVSTVTEQQLWLTDKLENIENVLMNLLKGPPATSDMLLVVGMTTAVLWKTLHQTAAMATRHAHAMTLQLLQSAKPFPQLSLVYGMLAKFPVCLLVEKVTLGNKPFLIVLYDHLMSLNQRLMEVSGRFNAAKTLALWSASSSVCVPECTTCRDALVPTGPLVTSLLQCVWTQWDDPVEGIRYQMMEVFDRVVNLYQTCYSGDVEYKGFIPGLVDQLIKVTWLTRGKYVCLQSVLTHAGNAALFLELSPCLPDLVLKAMEHQSIALCAGNLWSKLSSRHSQQVTVDQWIQTWVDPILKRLQSCSASHQAHIGQSVKVRVELVSALPVNQKGTSIDVLPSKNKYALPAVLVSQDVMDYIKAKLSITDDSDGVSVYLLCLRHFRNLHPTLTSLSVKTIGPCLHHINDQIRIDALGLLCESKKTTIAPTPEELQMILSFMDFNMNSQSPLFRQQVLTLFKKLLIRTRECSISLVKKSNFTDLKIFKDFIRDYFKISFSSLFPGSSFQRRQFALQCLTLLAMLYDYYAVQSIEHGKWIANIFTCSDAMDSSKVKQLLHCIQDSYVTNKILAVELLNNLVSRDVLVDYMFDLISMAHGMMYGAKAADFTSSAYYIRLFMNVDCEKLSKVVKELNLKWINKIRQASKLHDDTLYSSVFVSKCKEPSQQLMVLVELINLLQLQLSLAQDNLLRASVETPVYGVLEVIRVSLETVDLRTIPDCFVHNWREFLSFLINISSSIAELVTPVVCNSSPEGCLPDQAIIALGNINIDLESSSGANAQSLVICCWHCMKEVSLLLGDIVEKAPLILAESELSGLISTEQVLSIGKLFTYHLMEAKHMGAFEMAYAGFQKLCGVLWVSSSTMLRQKPKEWAQELLDSFQSQDSDCRVTRRSAGVPYYLLAILCTEPDLTGRSCLKTAMSTLLDIALNDQSDSSSLQPSCVHALNILRAIFRESRLGDHVMPYVASGFKAALYGVSSHVWAVRNSSTLVFSALMTRVFGVKRLSDEHCQENKMASKQFFTKFPSLHSFLLKELDIATLPLEEERFDVLHPSLFPMLLLLSRLYPSTLDDGGDPSKSLQSFIPLVLRCAKSSVWKIREAASRALLTLLSQTELTRCIELLFSNNLGAKCNRQNRIHGLLLMLHTIVMNMFPVDLETGVTTLDLLYKISWIGKQGNNNPITRALYLQVLGIFFDQLHSFVPIGSNKRCHYDNVTDKKELLSDALRLLTVTDGDIKVSLFYRELMVAACCYCYRLLTCFHALACDQEVILLAANLLSCDPSCDDVITSFILLCLHHSVREVSQCILYELKRKALSTSTILALSSTLSTMSTSVSNPELLSMVYELLTHYHEICLNNNSNISSVLKLLKNAIKLHQQETIRMCLKEASITVVSFILSYHVNKIDDHLILTQWIEILKKNYGPTQPESLRKTVASAFAQSWRALLQCSNNNDSVVVMEFWLLLVELLQDYNIDCRNEAARCVTHIKSHIQGCNHQSMHPQYCLDVVFNLMRQLHGENLSMHIKVILHFLKVADIANITDGCNILFIEGPINDYKEEAVQLKCVCRNLMLTISHSITDAMIMKDVNIFATNMITDVSEFIKCISESSTVQHHSHIINSVYKIKLVLDVLQLIDDSVKSVQSRLASLSYLYDVSMSS